MKTLDERTDETRQRFIDRQIGLLDQAAAMTESPIERAMLWALVTAPLMDGYQGCFLYEHPFHCLPGVPKEAKLPGIDMGDTTIFPQLNVKGADRTYRLDLAIDVAVAEADGSEWHIWIDVECDGHDFHERTKDQAERDRRRDRDLQALGWRVIRFTGSEIFRDPEKAAGDVRRFCSRIALRRGEAR